MCFIPVTVLAQNEEPTVPDVTGLNVPQAAAVLNAVGLRLGSQDFTEWTEASGLPQNTISHQSVEAGTIIEEHGIVDVTLLVTNNVHLIYDDNDLTLINLVNDKINLTDVTFKAVDGTQPTFDAVKWGDELRENQCFQLWSVSRNGPKGLPECQIFQNWLTTTNTTEHFWTATNGVSSFEVIRDGNAQKTCNAAPPNSQDSPTTCDFYLPVGQGDIIQYMYFVYTPERLIVMNPSQDKWLRANKTIITNPNPNNQILGSSFKTGDPKLFGSPDGVADIKRLAPGQCLLFKRDDVTNDPLPQSCNVIAELDLPANQLFWVFDFELESQDKTHHTCTGAIQDKRTICVIPR
jgi:hypothetical protein